jgi:peptidoglycan/xylan/chitin deacetylase (PgdA/CDA1 family)
MKSFSRRDLLKLGGAALLAAALPPIDFAQADSPRAAPLLMRGSTRHRQLALTYDDCYLFDRLLDLERLLDEFPEFKVTLFPVGLAILNLASRDAGIWKRFCEKGHEIGYHSWDHQNFADLSTVEALDDYARWLDALSNVLGYEPCVRFARPTFGSLAYSFRNLCRALGLVNTMWSTGWGGPLEVGMQAAWNSRNGDIVLMHIRTEDCNTSRGVYPWLRENGWSAVTLSKLYDDLLLERNTSDGCDVNQLESLTRTCME